MIVTITPDQDMEAGLPAHAEEDEDWVYAIVTATGTTHLSDSASELIGIGLDGYPVTVETDDDATAALEMRYDDLLGYAAHFQRFLVAAAQENDVVNLVEVDDETLTTMLQERSIPFSGPSWTFPVPLVLLVTDYTPYTTIPAPQGNLVWLDPSTELTYLQSLDRVGAVKLFIRQSSREVEPSRS